MKSIVVSVVAAPTRHSPCNPLAMSNIICFSRNISECRKRSAWPFRFETEKREGFLSQITYEHSAEVPLSPTPSCHLAECCAFTNCPLLVSHDCKCCCVLVDRPPGLPKSWQCGNVSTLSCLRLGLDADYVHGIVPRLLDLQ